MSQTVQANPRALVESVARNLPPHARDDFRNLINEVILANLTALSPGGNLIQAGGPKAGGSQAPVGVTHSVIGANAAFTVAINNPPGSSKAQPIYHEISYSPYISFTKGVQTMAPTTATSVVIPSPGGSYRFRLRSSLDLKTWSDYQYATTDAIDAGYVGSDATAPGSTFNQSNFAVVTAVSSPIQAITIAGATGPYTPYTAVKGSIQSLRPSATIVGSALSPNTDQFVAWDGDQFQTAGVLADLMQDGYEPVGKVTIGQSGTGGGGATGGNGARLTAV